MSLFLRIILFVIVLYLLGCGSKNNSSSISAYRFGHEAVLAFSQLSALEKQSAANLKIYFEHASVGANIISGIQDLIGNSQSPIKSASLSNVEQELTDPRAQTIKTWFISNTGIYDNPRGNPGLANKVSWFNTSIHTRGLGSVLDVALMKFCYIDNESDADTTGFNQYTAAMANLKNTYPSLTLIYVTMPLQTTSDTIRNSFNSRLRVYCDLNNFWLYDIADIESHNPDGSLNAQAGGEALALSYSSDGGHLNSTGSLRAAQGLVALLARIAQSR